MRSILLCGFCFQTFVYVSLIVCLCVPHESTHRAPNSNCETVYQYLIGLLLIIVTHRTESSCLRFDVFLQKKLSAFFFLRAVRIIIKMLESRNNTNKPVLVGGKKKKKNPKKLRIKLPILRNVIEAIKNKQRKPNNF